MGKKYGFYKLTKVKGKKDREVHPRRCPSGMIPDLLNVFLKPLCVDDLYLPGESYVESVQTLHPVDLGKLLAQLRETKGKLPYTLPEDLHLFDQPILAI